MYNDKTFLDVLDKLVENYNNTPHSSHSYTPLQVYNGDENLLTEARKRSEKYRMERIFRGSSQTDEIPIGSTVRVAKRSRSEDRRIHQRSHKGYLQTYDTKLHVVKKRKIAHAPGNVDKYQLEGVEKQYTRGQLLVVPKNTNNEPLERPIFVDTFRGAHQTNDCSAPS